MRESVIEAYLKQRVEALGGEALKFVSPGRRHVSDRMCILPSNYGPPYIVFVETKRPKGKPRAGQARFLKRLKTFKVEVEVIDTKIRVGYWIDSIKVREAVRASAPIR